MTTHTTTIAARVAIINITLTTIFLGATNTIQREAWMFSLLIIILNAYLFWEAINEYANKRGESA